MQTIAGKTASDIRKHPMFLTVPEMLFAFLSILTWLHTNIHHTLKLADMKGLQRSGKAPSCRYQRVASVYFRKFPVFSALKMSTLKFPVTTPGRWTITFSFVKIMADNLTLDDHKVTEP